MHEVIDKLAADWSAGETSALATVVSTHGSAPRGTGASMLVTSAGDAFGSVSGGCVEGAVYDLAKAVLSGADPQLVRYGFSDSDAFAVGLTCGGILDVFVQRVDQATFPQLASVASDVEAGRHVGLATVVAHPDGSRLGSTMVLRRGVAPSGSLGSPDLEAVVLADARALIDTGGSRLLSFGQAGQRMGDEVSVFVWAFAPPPRMIVFGAVDFAAAMARMGGFLGYSVTVCDARPVFATAARFPGVDDVVVDWPHRYLRREAEEGRVDGRTVVCVLTHDPKFDVPVLKVALSLHQVGYVGAMGSRRTHVDRLARLLDAGVTKADLARLHSPIGLDLGARTPEETAASIAAEIIAVRNRATGLPLGHLEGPIHEPDVPRASGE